MKILMAGSSGLIGTALRAHLQEQGHTVIRLLRGESKGEQDAIVWDPERGFFNRADFEDFDAVINLAGENIFSGRWTKEKKRRIVDSRVKETRTLCTCLGSLQQSPRVLINASAMGFYGDQGDTLLTESSPNGHGFLAEVCRDWEAATEQAQLSGIRVVMLRTSIVLTPKGGALAKMLPPFKLGLGGVLGDGKQYMSWVTLEDMLGIISFALDDTSLQGPINVGTPNPVTNEEFTKTLGKVLNRPTILPVPAFVLRLALGEVAGEVLSSTRMSPKKLLNARYAFLLPNLEEALLHLLQTKEI